MVIQLFLKSERQETELSLALRTTKWSVRQLKAVTDNKSSIAACPIIKATVLVLSTVKLAASFLSRFGDRLTAGLLRTVLHATFVNK